MPNLFENIVLFRKSFTTYQLQNINDVKNIHCTKYSILPKVLLKQSGKFESVPACCLPLETLANSEILTSQTFNKSESGRKLIDAFSENFASQCGFCTSGMAVSMCTKNEASGSKVLDGNFCRCTGYRPILQDWNHKNLKTVPYLNYNSFTWAIPLRKKINSFL